MAMGADDAPEPSKQQEPAEGRKHALKGVPDSCWARHRRAVVGLTSSDAVDNLAVASPAPREFAFPRGALDVVDCCVGLAVQQVHNGLPLGEVYEADQGG